VSPAGEAFATLPARVPRFWMATPPTSAQARARRGRLFAAAACSWICAWVTSAPMRTPRAPTEIRVHSRSPDRSRTARPFASPAFHPTIRSVPPARGSSSGLSA
jgi:hypothetical protein